MKFFPTKIIHLISTVLFIFLSISCSKDTDLLADYPAPGPDGGISVNRLVVNDTYVVFSNNTTVLDVLQNDNLSDSGNVTIVGTSDPANGDVVINQDNTLSYTSDGDGSTEDNFTYTVEVSNTDGSVTSETGEVNVTVTTQEVLEEVSFWKAQFDAELYENDDVADLPKMLEQSKSGNKFQEYYYMYYYFDGYLSMWQATGDNSYLDTMLTVIKNTMADAKPVEFNPNYLGWKADASYGLDYPKNGVALWESYFYKAVTTLLRIMHRSPSLMSGSYDGGTYKDAYEEILAFTEQHIWNKWVAKGSSYIYRSRTHMASHWARMGMELYIITGNKKYKEVFDNISFGTMPGVSSNLRDRMFQNPDVPGAVTWDSKWDSAKGNAVQDTPHASDLVTFWILAYENGMYWDENDIDGLVTTLDKVVFKPSDGPNNRLFVDGSGGYDTYGRLRDWVKLGRYDRALQNRLISQYQSDKDNARRYAIQNLGNFALNEKILLDGAPVYPEY